MVQTQCHTGHSHDLSAFAHVWWSFSSQQHLTGKYISQFTATIQTTFINVCVLQWSNAAADCTAAIGIDAVYLKAYMRRATAYEQSDDLERALTDLKKVRKITRGVNRVTLDAVLLPAQRMSMRWCATFSWPPEKPAAHAGHPRARQGSEPPWRARTQCTQGGPPCSAEYHRHFEFTTSRSWSWTPATRRRWPRLQNWNR